MTLDRDLLVLQIDTLLAELARVGSWLEDAAAAGHVRLRVKQGFAAQIQVREAELTSLASRVRSAVFDPALAWSLLRGYRQQNHYLFQESLAYLQGVLSRQAGLDSGLCPIADSLLDGISARCGVPWERFTIVAEGEFFQDMVGIIRLRFPDASVWSLPVAAHEFGHYVAQEMRTRVGGSYTYPFQEYLDNAGAGDPIVIAHLNEFFADLFATYVLGPAYACTCLLLRFDPGTGDSATHPSAARRAYLILRMLEEMGKSSTLPPFANILAWLRERWGELLASAGQPELLAEAERTALESTLIRNFVLLKKHLLAEARYEGWSRARILSSDLAAGGTDFVSLQPGDTLADILNAAWYLRIMHWEQSDDISQAAAIMCRQVMSANGQ